MSRVLAVVEGQTEQTFVRQVLAPWLGERGVFLSARLVGKPGKKGGVGEYPRAKKDMLALLKQEPTTIVTTMFDFYRMPGSWPGRDQARTAPYDQKASIVQSGILADITAALGQSFNPSRFVPYVQMYEYEALLFTKPTIIADVVNNPDIAASLVAIRGQFRTPEEINDSPTTAPSKRIERLHPTYEKPLHGSIAAQRIGIEALLAECLHFQEWVMGLIQRCQQGGN